MNLSDMIVKLMCFGHVHNCFHVYYDVASV